MKIDVSKTFLIWREIGIIVLAVTTLISLNLLFTGIMGGDAGSNEVDVLPLAKQYVDSTWIPRDWYLNQPPGYRLLFQSLFGRLVVTWGFLATSLTGRLVCYILVASGLVLIGRVLGLSMPLLLLAVALFLSGQSVVAGEWLVGGLEAKSIAYGLILLAIGLMLEGQYLWMSLMLGIATSLHVLVGGWAFLAVLGWLVLKRKTYLVSIQDFGLVILIYLAAGALAIKAVVQQLVTPTPPGSVLPSFIYVFLRLPHHLNPLSWPSTWWVKPLLYLLVLGLSVALLRRKATKGVLPLAVASLPRQQSKTLWQSSKQHLARMGLAEFTLISLVPFMLGLAVAPFDSQGSLLQYYPFRLGDVMLPLNTSLLFACVLQETFTGKSRQVLLLVCVMLLSWQCSTEVVSSKNRLLALHQFPSQDQDIDDEWKALSDWVYSYTPKDTIFVSPPVEFVNFTWLTERPTIAKFKLLSQTKAGILAWYERLNDLSGNILNDYLSSKISPLPTHVSINVRAGEVTEVLTAGYNNLTTAQANALMTKYRAEYLVTRIDHYLDLPVTYHNSHYILYKKAS